jgi:hypothetical protein
MMSSEIISRLRVPEDVSKGLLERRAAPPQELDTRRFPRRYLVAQAVVEYRDGLPAHPRHPQRHNVVVADLSRGGLRFLHSEQLFPGELAIIQIAAGKQMHIEVARCRKIADCCYEVGAMFSAGHEQA